MTEYHYCTSDTCDPAEFENSYKFTSQWAYHNRDVESVAEEAAEDYYDNHDGWESKWPLILTIYSTDGIMLGRVKVWMEFQPSFSGREEEVVPAQTP